MKETQFDVENSTEIQQHSQKYINAVNAINAAKKKREQQGYAAVYMATSMAGGVHEAGKPGPVVVAARTFCILFAFVVPNLLLIRYAF